MTKESNKPKKLLLISYYFPPIQSAEVTMTLNYVKYIPRFGWDPAVLCGVGLENDRYDHSQLTEIPTGISVHRIKACHSSILNILGNLRILPLKEIVCPLYLIIRALKDIEAGWVFPAAKEGKRILEKRDIEVLISRSSPIISHFVGLILKSLTGLPWIACFSDPWTLNPYSSYSNKSLFKKKYQRVHEYMELKIFSNANCIIFTTEYTAARYLEKYPSILSNKVSVIPNSYDPSEFSEQGFYSKTDKFTITYIGRFYGIRSPEPFLKALKLLKEEDDRISEKIMIKLIGRLDNFDYLISKYNLNDIICIINTIPHREVISHLYSSDVLLLVDAPSETGSMFLPSKLIEYLHIGKPILAITPEEGASADVVRATRTGIVVPPQDIEGIKKSIKKFYNDYVKGNLKTKTDWDEVNKYSAENCTKTLIKTIELLINQRDNENK
ncbi:MAG: glycosyltransferase family 4 protein [Methanophagales archaeon]|nr:glycosyltransferase family 4 protein [Methanophagales archaeon]